MQRQQLELPLGQEEESLDKCLETHPCGQRDAVRELMVPGEAHPEHKGWQEPFCSPHLHSETTRGQNTEDLPCPGSLSSNSPRK